MQANVGVRVIPMAAGPMPPVNERDGSLRFGQEGVGESHSHRAGANDQIVGFDGLTGPGFLRREFAALSHGAPPEVWL